LADYGRGVKAQFEVVWEILHEEVFMKKGLLFILVLFVLTINLWGQSQWLYDSQWGGITEYTGSGRAIFEDRADLHNNYTDGKYQRIEHPSNEQMNLIKYGLRQYTVRTNDVYTILLLNYISHRAYVILAIITNINGDFIGDFSFYLWEDISYRRN